MDINISIRKIRWIYYQYFIEEKCKLANIIHNNDSFSSLENNFDFMTLSKSNLVIS